MVLEKALRSLLESKEIKPIHPEGINPEYSLGGLLLLKLRYFGHLMRRADSLEKTLMLEKDRWQEKKRVTEDEMAGWLHQFNGHEFEQTPGDSEGQGSMLQSIGS